MDRRHGKGPFCVLNLGEGKRSGNNWMKGGIAGLGYTHSSTHPQCTMGKLLFLKCKSPSLLSSLLDEYEKGTTYTKTRLRHSSDFLYFCLIREGVSPSFVFFHSYIHSFFWKRVKRRNKGVGVRIETKIGKWQKGKTERKARDKYMWGEMVMYCTHTSSKHRQNSRSSYLTTTASRTPRLKVRKCTCERATKGIFFVCWPCLSFLLFESSQEN